MGRMQVSACSCHYYGVRLSKPSALHSPAINLSCGAKILKKNVGRDKILAGYSKSRWKGAAAYWSVFRKKGTTARIKRTLKKNFLPATKFCS